MFIYILYNYNVFVSTKMYLLRTFCICIVSTIIFFKVIVVVSIIRKKCVIVIVSIIHFLSIAPSSADVLKVDSLKVLMMLDDAMISTRRLGLC